MKSFTRISLFFLFLMINSSVANAQKAHFIVTFSPIVPLSFMQDANIGLLSGSLGFTYDITSKLSWTFSAGYNRFGTKTTTIYGTNAEYKSTLTFVPVLTGIQFYFKNDGLRIFSVLKAGYYLPSNDLVEGDFGFSPGFGVQIPSKTSKSKFDLSLCYNGVLGAKTKEFSSGTSSQVSTYYYLSYIAINVALAF
jgi:hypothetical protein